ncbi:hypothetical protein [Ideonella sp.]|uniref:hypothetical protein n=1 Tax=Ideonella sp. TaxID=1929293 RepID=UPI003BB55830
MATKNTRAGTAGPAAALVAETISEGAKLDSLSAPADPAPMHQPFSCCNPYDRTGCLPAHVAPVLASTTFDVAGGVRVVLQMLEQEEIDSAFVDDAEQPLPRLLPAPARAALLRLAVTSLDLLAGESERVIERWRASTEEKAGGNR